MADFCHACAIETWGEDAGDLAGLTTPEQAANEHYAVALCEGCGPTLVDAAGCRVATLAAEQPMPRILNKHVHGIPAGARYIGRGSPFGNPFVIGRDGTRDEVCDKYDAWIVTQPGLLARLPELRGQDLVCFCAPLRCHGLTLRRLANPPVCEAA